MAEITASLVKELRERTGAGMMDCKKALVKANGDIEAAIEDMRKNGQAKAAKKAGRVAAEGIIVAKTEGNTAALVELNCETDFVAKDASFRAIAEKVAEVAVANKTEDVEAIKNADFGNGETIGTTLTNLIAKIGENMNLRRVKVVSGDNLGVYIHSNNSIGVIVELKGGDQELAKDVALLTAKELFRLKSLLSPVSLRTSLKRWLKAV